VSPAFTFHEVERKVILEAMKAASGQISVTAWRISVVNTEYC